MKRSWLVGFAASLCTACFSPNTAGVAGTSGGSSGSSSSSLGENPEETLGGAESGTTADPTGVDPSTSTGSDPEDDPTSDDPGEVELCGNGALDEGEACEPGVVLRETCVGLRFDSGELSCDANCQYDLSGCVSDSCGNGVVEPPEQCEPSIDNEVDDCALVPGQHYMPGPLDCRENCTLDTSECIEATCECTENAPVAWEGPVWVASGANVLDCPLEAPEMVLQLGGDLNVPESTCECDCDAPELYCGTLGAWEWEDDGCRGQSGPTSPPATEACLNGHFETVGASGSPFASCGEVNAVAEVPATSWSVSATLCAGPDAGGCATGETCLDVPSAPFNNLCVFRVGEHACPTDFLERTVLYQGVDDDRACAACESCTASDVDCGWVVDEYALSNCVGTPTTRDLGDVCLDDAPSHRIRLEVTDAGSCTTPHGELLNPQPAPSDPVTICCQ